MFLSDMFNSIQGEMRFPKNSTGIFMFTQFLWWCFTFVFQSAHVYVHCQQRFFFRVIRKALTLHNWYPTFTKQPSARKRMPVPAQNSAATLKTTMLFSIIITLRLGWGSRESSRGRGCGRRGPLGLLWKQSQPVSWRLMFLIRGSWREEEGMYVCVWERRLDGGCRARGVVAGVLWICNKFSWLLLERLFCTVCTLLLE